MAVNNYSLTKLINRCAVILLMILPGGAVATVLHPAIVTTDAFATRAGVLAPPAESFTLKLSAMGRDLELNLVPSAVASQLHSADLIGQLLPSLYQGVVAGDDTSWARINVEAGLATGYLFTYGQLLRLELIERLPKALALSAIGTDTRWVVFEPDTSDAVAAQLPPIDHIRWAPKRNSNTPDEQTTDQQVVEPDAQNADPLAVQRASGNALAARQSTPRQVTRAMRVGIAIDSRYNDFHHGRGAAHALEIMNGVDGIYQQQLGLALIIDTIRVYADADTDPMRNKSGTVEQILTAYRDIRLGDHIVDDKLALIHLFTGHTDPQQVVGLGWINTVCRTDGYDMSMSTPFPFDMLLAAHEMAHNLGALHDDDPQCTDQISNGDGIMWSRISNRTLGEFSSCSLSHMQPALQANCNVDNIDLAISMQATRTRNDTQRIIAVQVLNKDEIRSARDVHSRTVFPVGSLISNQSAVCLVDENVLLCNHGTIEAGTNSAISVLITLAPIAGQQQVVAGIESGQLADNNPLDNHAVLNVQQLAADDANTIASSTVEPEPSPASAGGSLRVTELIALLLAALLARFVRQAWPSAYAGKKQTLILPAISYSNT
jgi:hypothetical protein